MSRKILINGIIAIVSVACFPRIVARLRPPGEAATLPLGLYLDMPTLLEGLEWGIDQAVQAVQGPALHLRHDHLDGG
jgi:hypothetical protein